jgi:hypothetical protein
MEISFAYEGRPTLKGRGRALRLKALRLTL